MKKLLYKQKKLLAIVITTFFVSQPFIAPLGSYQVGKAEEIVQTETTETINNEGINELMNEEIVEDAESSVDEAQISETEKEQGEILEGVSDSKEESDVTSETQVEDEFLKLPQQFLQESENAFVTLENVEVGKTYEYPLNKLVSVTFSELPAVSGKLYMQEITISDEEMNALGATSNRAYKIYTDIPNYTFKYNLTLPNPTSISNPEVKFSSTEEELLNSSELGGETVANTEKVTIYGLDHFTVFVVVNPSSSSVDNSIGSEAWSNPSNVYASDNSYATVTLDNNASEYTLAHGLNASIPSNAVVQGIEVKIEKSVDVDDAGENTVDGSLRLIKNGVIVGTDHADTATQWTTTDTVATYGGASDLWGEVWTAADINAANFGVAFAAQKNFTDAQIAQVDHISVTVYYNTPPTISVNSPNGSELFAGGSSQNITWTAADVDADTLTIDLEYTTDGSTWNSITTGLANSGTYSWTVPTVDTTLAQVRAIASDGFSMSSDTSDVSFEIDSSITQISNIVVAADYNPYVRGAVDGFKIWMVANDIHGVAACEYTLDNGTTWNAAYYNTLAPFPRCQADLVTAANAQALLINMRVTDTLGNQGTGSAINRTADSLFPVASGFNISPNNGGKTSGTPVLTWNVSDDLTNISACQYRYKKSTDAWAVPPVWATGTIVTGGLNASCSVVLSGLEDGQTYNFQVNGKDGVNYSSIASPIITLSVDASFPTVKPLVVAADYNPYVRGASGGFKIWMEAKDDVGITSCEYTLDNGVTWLPAYYNTVPAQDRCQVDGVTAPNGQVLTINMRASDSVGNVSTGSAIIRTADSTFPSVSGFNITNVSGIYISSSPTLNWTATDNLTNISACQYRYKKSTDAWPNPPVWSAGTIVTPGTTATCKADLSGLQDGATYNFQVNAKDYVNYTSLASPILTYKVDGSLPVVTLNAYTPDPTSDSTPDYTGNASDAVLKVIKVEYRVDGGTWVNATAVDGTFDELSEDFTFTPTLSDGTHLIEVKATDEVGNISIIVSDTLEVDTVAPTAVFKNLTVAEIVNNFGELPALAPSALTKSEDIFNVSCLYPTLGYPINFENVQNPITVNCDFEDGAGNVGNATYTVTVTDSVPTVNITTNPGDTTTGVAITMTANAADGNPGYTYSWGSGNFAGCTGSSTTVTTPSTGGTYTCVVTVTDSDGDTAIDVQSVIVNPTANNPVSVFLAANSPATNDGSGNVFVNQNTSFTINATLFSNFGDPNYTYTFGSFGGVCNNTVSGTASTSVSSNTLNLSAGNYFCSVTVTDSNGSTSSAGVNIIVSAPVTPSSNNNGNVLGVGTDNNSFSESTTTTPVSFPTTTNTVTNTGSVLGESTCESKKLVSGLVTDESTSKGVGSVRVEVYFTESGRSQLIGNATTDAGGSWRVEACPGRYDISIVKASIPSGKMVKGDATISRVLGDNANITDANFVLKSKGLDLKLVAIPVGILLALVVLFLIFGRRKDDQQF